MNDNVAALTSRLNEMENLLKRATASTPQYDKAPDGVMVSDYPSDLEFVEQSRSQLALPQLPQLLWDPGSTSFETLLRSRSQDRLDGFGECLTERICNVC